jgi:hypothetical protein
MRSKYHKIVSKLCQCRLILGRHFLAEAVRKPKVLEQPLPGPPLAGGFLLNPSLIKKKQKTEFFSD